MKITKNASVHAAKTEVKEAGRQLAEQATRAAESGKQEVAEYLEERKGEAVETVRDLDQALRQTAQNIEHPGMGRLVESLASEVERLAQVLESTGYDDIVASTHRVARQSPTLFLAGSFALGMVAARFLRSSARHASPQSYETIY